MKESKQPKSINFGFENCEHAEIPIEHVESFYIRKCYTTKSYYPHGQGLHTYDVIDSLEVTFKDSFREYSYPMFGNINENCIVKDRIKKYPDICWFSIKYDNDLQETYQVKWQGQDDVYQEVAYQDEKKGQSYVEGGVFGDVLSVKP